MKLSEIMTLLFYTNNTNNNSNRMYLVATERKRRIIGIVGNASDAVVVISRLYSFDECSLFCAEHIDMVPLEEDVGE